MAQLPPVPIGAPVTDESGFSSQVWSSWFQRMSSQVQGLSITSVTGAYTASFDDDVILANATGGAFSVTLPNAEERKGKVLFIKKTDASGNAVTLDGFDSQTIDGSATHAIASQYNSRTIVSDGSNWMIIGDR
jgi:hypothetical protein